MSLTVISRADWKARPPVRPRTRRSRASITEFFLHWPGSEGSLAAINTAAEERAWLRETQHFHMTKPDDPYIDLGYNLVMGNGRDGKVPRVYTGRGLQYLPASQLGHNPGTASLCVILGARDELTDEMISRIRSVIRYVEQYSGNRLRVRGHREVVGTTCPGPQITAALRAGKFNIHR